MQDPRFAGPSPQVPLNYRYPAVPTAPVFCQSETFGVRPSHDLEIDQSTLPTMEELEAQYRLRYPTLASADDGRPTSTGLAMARVLPGARQREILDRTGRATTRVNMFGYDINQPLAIVGHRNSAFVTVIPVRTSGGNGGAPPTPQAP